MARGPLALALLLLAFLAGGCSSPSFALVNIIMPGGRVSVAGVNHENEKGTPPKEAAPAVAEVLPELFKGEAGNTQSKPAAAAPWKPLITGDGK